MKFRVADMSVRASMSIKVIAGLALSALLVACGPVIREHGFVPFDEDLSAIVVGVDTKLTVEEVAGRPSDTGLTDGNAWYYVATTVRNFAFFAPKVVERRVMVFDFDNNDVLQKITEFGLEDGRVINLQTRTTPTDSRRLSLLRRLLGNIGSVTPPLPS